jgi:LmbE family N-acetylglucosaminyl deacetylase
VEQFDLVPNSALAIYAHPDDADVACGGTLARWSLKGAQVHLVVVCDGSKGTHDAHAIEGDVRAVREDELATAAELLGLASVTRLAYVDGEFTNDAQLCAALVALVRRLRPEVVLGPDPTAVFFGGVYINHRDHRETGWAVLDAVAPASAMPKYFPDAGPAHAVSHLLLSGTHEPDVVVDVTDAIDHKVAAVAAHHSQVVEDSSWVSEVVGSRAALAGREIGVSFGEPFRHVALGL